MKRLYEPEGIKTPSRIFVCSMGEVFDPERPTWHIERLWDAMARMPQHTYIVLTKRPDRMHEFVSQQVYLPNVWLGVSVTNETDADERIPLLLRTRAAVRFVSYEPALGEVDFSHINYSSLMRETLRDFANFSGMDPDKAAAEVSQPCYLDVLNGRWFDGWDSGTDSKCLDWLICGAQTGPGAVPPRKEWVESLRRQCNQAGVAYFEKQSVRPIVARELIQEWPKEATVETHH